MILAIETSDILCSVAFWDKGRTLIEYNLEIPMQHASLVGQLVNKGLTFLAEESERPKYDVKDISLIAVAIGPGSFTGLRIGLSFAQGFCFANNIPIAGISNHQVLAAQAAQWEGKLYTLIEARRNEVYLAQIETPETGYPAVGKHQIAKKENLAKIIEPGSQIIAATNLSLEKEVFKQFAEQEIVFLSNRPYSAKILAALGQKKMDIEGADNLAKIEPLYIRPFAGVV